MNESAVIYRVLSPPLSRPWTALRSLSSPGGFTHHEALRIRVSPLLPPYVIPLLPKYSGVWFLSGSRFHARARGQGASTPWQSLTLVLATTLLGHDGAVIMYSVYVCVCVCVCV